MLKTNFLMLLLKIYSSDFYVMMNVTMTRQCLMLGPPPGPVPVGWQITFQLDELRAALKPISLSVRCASLVITSIVGNSMQNLYRWEVIIKKSLLLWKIYIVCLYIQYFVIFVTKVSFSVSLSSVSFTKFKYFIDMSAWAVVIKYWRPTLTIVGYLELIRDLFWRINHQFHC